MNHPLSILLSQPEYVHVIINHFPLTGLLVAVVALVVGLCARNRTAVVIGLALVVLLSLSAWPTYHYGEAAYDRVLSMTDDAGARYLQYHEALAERWIFLYYLTAAAGCIALVAAWKWPRALIPTALLAVLLACASLSAGVVIAHAGGAIRHREFRIGPPPPAPKTSGRPRYVARNWIGTTGTPGRTGATLVPSQFSSTPA